MPCRRVVRRAGRSQRTEVGGRLAGEEAGRTRGEGRGRDCAILRIAGNAQPGVWRICLVCGWS